MLRLAFFSEFELLNDTLRGSMASRHGFIDCCGVIRLRIDGIHLSLDTYAGTR